MKNKNYDLSVVILCYKSEDFAKVFCKRAISILNKSKINYELVLVANFWPKSEDSTPVIVTQLAKKYKRVNCVVKAKHKKFHNMGWDARLGLAATTGVNIALIDGDGQSDIYDVVRVFERYKKLNLDICKLKRISRKDGIYRIIISKTFNILMNLIFPRIGNDINGKPKIFSRDLYNRMKLKSNDWFIDAEIMLKARKLGVKIGEINGKFKENPSRDSFISFKQNFEFIKNMLKWRMKEFGIKL